MKIKQYLLQVFLIVITLSSTAQSLADFRSDTTIVCESVVVYFNDLSISDTTIITRLWEFEGGTPATSSTQNPVVVYDTAGVYNVKLTVADENSNVDSEIKTEYITVRKRPVAAFILSPAQDYFLTDTFSLSSFFYDFTSQSILDETPNDILKYSYYWDFGDGVFVDSTSSLIYKFQNSGDYSVRFVINAGKECTDTADASVTVEDIKLVPNIFTPNGDGINDFLTIKTNGIHTYELFIFSRWGVIVHTISAKKITWDGHTSAGILVDPGVYYYHLSSAENGHSETGFIHVMR